MGLTLLLLLFFGALNVSAVRDVDSFLEVFFLIGFKHCLELSGPGPLSEGAGGNVLAIEHVFGTATGLPESSSGGGFFRRLYFGPSMVRFLCD